MDQAKRDRIVELVRKMQENTVSKGCTPGEAAKFAAKVQEWIEEYQITEAELKVKDRGGREFDPDDIEVCQNKLRTGKKAFNPGMTAVVNALAIGSCCRLILLHERNGGKTEAVYGVIGTEMDANYVCQISITVVPALQIMAKFEGAEYGHEKGDLIKWTNEYLTGAAQEILKRLEEDRRQRAEVKRLEHEAQVLINPASCTALMCITGETIAKAKREAAESALAQLYPNTRRTYSRRHYDATARERGRIAGRSVGLHQELPGA